MLAVPTATCSLLQLGLVGGHPMVKVGPPVWPVVHPATATASRPPMIKKRFVIDPSFLYGELHVYAPGPAGRVQLLVRQPELIVVTLIARALEIKRVRRTVRVERVAAWILAGLHAAVSGRQGLPVVVDRGLSPVVVEEIADVCAERHPAARVLHVEIRVQTGLGERLARKCWFAIAAAREVSGVVVVPGECRVYVTGCVVGLVGQSRSRVRCRNAQVAGRDLREHVIDEADRRLPDAERHAR